MKLPSWGHGIALLYTLFAVFILGLVWRSFGQRIELVTDNYYEKELEYNAQMEKTTRARQLGEPISWTVHGDSLSLRFPGVATAGRLVFQRPSDARADTAFTVGARHDSTMTVSLAAFQRGAYRLKADWTMAGVTYYSEHIVVIP